jgi:hypothetical protein
LCASYPLIISNGDDVNRWDNRCVLLPESPKTVELDQRQKQVSIHESKMCPFHTFPQLLLAMPTAKTPQKQAATVSGSYCREREIPAPPRRKVHDGYGAPELFGPKKCRFRSGQS